MLKLIVLLVVATGALSGSSDNADTGRDLGDLTESPDWSGGSEGGSGIEESRSVSGSRSEDSGSQAQRK